MDSDAWSALLYTWAPILLMIGFWLFFMRKFKKQTTQLLERIAVALERRNARD
jgi:ATP-dependent Zn protease